MDKILAPADKVLSEIGRLILLKPWLSSLLLLLAFMLTVITGKVVENVAPRHLNLQLPALTEVAPSDMPWTQTNLINEAIASRPASTASVAQDSSPEPLISMASKPPAAPAAHVTYVNGRVHHNLAADAKKLGLPVGLANQLSALSNSAPFGHIHAGDQFSVLYDTSKNITTTTTITKSGHKKKAKITHKTSVNNAILALQVTHDGKNFSLIHFTDPKGHGDFYTPNGESLHEAISRQPIAYTHISSCFSYSRFDPVLHFVRPHLGVDYAAPFGTPVKAAGNGVIAGMGYRGGYGNAVIIRHDDKYSTLYGHLARFASNVRLGQTVQQGEVVGYVGQTGFATGPHLHFEIRAYDVPYNPLTIALPGAAVPSVYRARFMAQAKVLMGELRGNQQIHLAQKKTTVHQG